jgi:sigma-B regulation protein RsbU (phosphoserine phosphatase)
LARGFDRYVEWNGAAGTADALRRATAGLVISLTTRTAHRALTGTLLSRALLERDIITQAMAPAVGGATQEAIANAVIHGNLGLRFGASAEFEDIGAFHRAVTDRLAARDAAERRVTIDIGWTAADVTVAISDEGPGFESPNFAPSGGETPGEAATGRGLLVMRSLASRVAFEADGRRAVLGFARGA